MILTIHSAAIAAAACLLPAAPVSAELSSAAVAAIQPMVGGYRAVEADDAHVRAAAAFAAAQLDNEVDEILSAHRQTVQGANYRIEFTTADGRHVRVVVYQPLRGELQLTSQEDVE